MEMTKANQRGCGAKRGLHTSPTIHGRKTDTVPVRISSLLRHANLFHYLKKRATHNSLLIRWLLAAHTQSRLLPLGKKRGSVYQRHIIHGASCSGLGADDPWSQEQGHRRRRPGCHRKVCRKVQETRIKYMSTGQDRLGSEDEVLGLNKERDQCTRWGQ